MEEVVLTAISGPNTITRTLYGPRTSEQLTWEQADLDRRAEQLNVRAYHSLEVESRAAHYRPTT